MLGVEKLCKRLSSFISKELDLEKDKEAVVNYGIFSLIQIFMSIGLVIVYSNRNSNVCRNRANK